MDRVAFCQCQVPFLQLLADWQSSAGEFDRYFTGFWDKIIILRGGCTIKFDYLVPTHLLSYSSNGFPVVLLVVADQNPVLVCQFPSQIPHPLPQDRQGKWLQYISHSKGMDIERQQRQGLTLVPVADLIRVIWLACLAGWSTGISLELLTGFWWTSTTIDCCELGPCREARSWQRHIFSVKLLFILHFNQSIDVKDNGSTHNQTADNIHNCH